MISPFKTMFVSVRVVSVTSPNLSPSGFAAIVAFKEASVAFIAIR